MKNVIDDDAIRVDGFDNCLIGLGFQFTSTQGVKTIALYDRRKCIEHIQEQDGISFDDAEEFFEYNIQGTYIGEGMPVFIRILNKEELHAHTDATGF